VVPPLPLVRAIFSPSTASSSAAPSVTLVIVRITSSMVWPLSTVLIAVPLKMPAAAPPSVKVGSSPVPVKVGASFTATMVTVEEIASTELSTPPLAVPPES